jgi:hypothetical protein
MLKHYNEKVVKTLAKIPKEAEEMSNSNKKQNNPKETL